MSEGINISEYVYEKKFQCPVCESTFTSPAARYGKSRIVSVDSDLKQNYSPFNPILYDVVVCSACGYAESVTAFANPLPEKTVELLLQEVKPKYWGHTYPLELDVDMALERYAIAIICNEVKKGKLGARAHMYLKMAWICRDAKEPEREQAYMVKALADFKQAFQAEKPPIAGMDENAVSYLIGELERRAGNEDEALRWFSKLVALRGVERRIKDRAIDQKELIMQKRRAEEAAESPAAKAENPTAKAETPEPKAESTAEKPKKKFKWF